MDFVMILIVSAIMSSQLCRDCQIVVSLPQLLQLLQDFSWPH